MRARSLSRLSEVPHPKTFQQLNARTTSPSSPGRSPSAWPPTKKGVPPRSSGCRPAATSFWTSSGGTRLPGSGSTAAMLW